MLLTMQKKQSRREYILQLLNHNNKFTFTCQDICKLIIFKENLIGNKAKYLSGSVSSILNKMVKDNVLKYSSIKTGPRGGYVYELKSKL